MARYVNQWPESLKIYIRDHIRCDFQTGLLYQDGLPVKTRIQTSKKTGKQYHYCRFPNHKTPLLVHAVVWFLYSGSQAVYWLDHQNGDSLHNGLITLPDGSEVLNIRHCTPKENARNKKKEKNATSIYKGVVKHTANAYRVVFQYDNRVHHLGSYRDELTASKVYDLASLATHGKYGRRNHPDSDYTPEQIQRMAEYMQQKSQAKRFERMSFDPN